MSLSKSTKRRKCLKGSEELNLAIESNNAFDTNSQSVVCQSASTSLAHYAGNVSNYITTESTSTESNYYSNDYDYNIMVDINVDNNILVPNFSSDSDSSSDNNENVLTSIKNWAVQHNISHIALSNLLKVLKTNHNCFHYFPNDSRTLLKTNVSKQPLQIQTINPGIFYYFGVVNGIKSCIGKNIFSDDTIKLHIGIDGLPLTKSTNSQFWPILCCIRNFNSIHPCVFLVGLYWGHEKPLESNMYLSEMVTELIDLCTNGIDLSLGKKKVVVEAFSCDAPAKSYILKIKGHTGFSSCTRCKTVGVFLERRVCFPDLINVKRTHDEFLNRCDEDYQTSDPISILSTIPGINMVHSFPLDYMHLVCLGVVKKKILLWLGCIKNSPLSIRLPSKSVKLISTRLLHLKICVTCDFARIPRGLNEVLRWKATEFRTFILYTGPIVLQSIIGEECYEHFICLHVCMTVLLSQTHGSLLHFIEKLLNYYVNKFGEIYGKEFMSHNIHALLHLIDDYKQFGPLDNCSCFPYENFMQLLKKMVRSNAKPLQQVVKRYEELNVFGRLTINNSKNSEFFKNIHSAGPLGEGCSSPQYTIFSKNNFTIKIKSLSDCYVGYYDATKVQIMKVLNICYHPESNSNVFVVQIFNTVKPFYVTPINSLKLGIASVSNLSNTFLVCDVNKIGLKKYMLLNTNDGKTSSNKIAFPILHS